MSFDYKTNKGFRLLNIYKRLNKGELIKKEELANDFNVSLKTIQRDIEELRNFIQENEFSESEDIIKYDKSRNGYYLVELQREWLTNEEALAMSKILLESRAFNKKEISSLIEKLIAQISPGDREIAKNIINNEYRNYVPLKHEKDLFSIIWTLSECITNQNKITFDYTRQDKKKKEKTVKPVAIMFSEFYFYLIAFSVEPETNVPVVFRIDRIENLKVSKEKFVVPYKDKFKDGEFRKRIQFMYMGELKKVIFEYSGIVEAILDKLPTAEIIDDYKNGTVLIKAECYGDGINMWLGAQGDKVKIIEEVNL
ncbi:MAG: WYL domain-containing protein [Ruminococcaceae bacterium]|nr:WYL domain-containing protein [Oscillospiraceae bacterium]